MFRPISQVIDGKKKGGPYDANHVTLEEGGMCTIHANGDARGMWELVLRGFLHHRSAINDTHRESLAVRNSTSRSLASLFPVSEGAMLSSRS